MHNLPLLSLKTTSNVRNLLAKRFESLNYKGNAIKVGNPATPDEIKLLASNLSMVLSSQSFEKLQGLSKADVINDERFKKFMDLQMYLTNYSLTIKKCNEPDCEFHSKVNVPEEVFRNVHFLPAPTLQSAEKYNKFDDVYGEVPTEKDRPSLKKSFERKPLNQPDFQLQQSKARMIVECA